MLQPCQAQGTLAASSEHSAQLLPWLGDCRSHAANSGRGSSRDRAGRERATDEDMLCSFPRGETRLRRNWGFPLVRSYLPGLHGWPLSAGSICSHRPLACRVGEPSHLTLEQRQRASQSFLCLLHARPVSHPVPGWTPPALGFRAPPSSPAPLSPNSSPS